MIAQCALHCIVKEGLYGSTEALGAGNAGDHPTGGPHGYHPAAGDCLDRKPGDEPHPGGDGRTAGVPGQKTAGKLAALIGGGIVAVLGVFYLVFVHRLRQHGTILGRTDVMGVDMSGLTVPQAQERWQQKGQAVCQTAQLPLTVDGETAGQVSLWELGVSMTPETAAQLAYKAAMPEANPVLLEPVGELKVTVPDSYMAMSWVT